MEEEKKELEADEPSRGWWARLGKNETFRKMVGHLSLIFALLVYTFIGALVFQALEYDEEVIQQETLRVQLMQDRRHFIQEILNLTESAGLSRSFSSLYNDQEGGMGKSHTEGEWEYEEESERAEKEERVSTMLRYYEQVVVDSGDARVTPLQAGTEPGWSFPQSVFFTATVLTTIGYGNIAPMTVRGKIFCIVFALVGIPLTLTIISDMGEVLASLVPVETLSKMLPKGKLRPVVTVLTVLCLLVGIIALGGCIFAPLQRWTFMDAFYFCFITTTTIGFGDLVPDVGKTWSLMGCTLYILVGPVFTSTVIELVRRQYASSWEQMKQLSLRLNTISGPLAEAMRKMAETGAGEVEVDANLVRELRDLDSAFTRVLREEEGGQLEEKEPEDDPWTALLNMAAKKKRITILMYESSV
ncbi:TWiK family of potassium channels protein 7-like isoform X1 [Penaeus chinensis]|uniref:TWiK family of potassium channels protein 7-like isoform X1 n=2 Tax=Penaeus chinensis TaxID=139456 RepID=UPI001FB7FBE7|nr:TWiK family of potassium channels protein 7-like isoform X1 [Penaeus chinensis]